MIYNNKNQTTPSQCFIRIKIKLHPANDLKQSRSNYTPANAKFPQNRGID